MIDSLLIFEIWSIYVLWTHATGIKPSILDLISYEIDISLHELDILVHSYHIALDADHITLEFLLVVCKFTERIE